MSLKLIVANAYYLPVNINACIIMINSYVCKKISNRFVYYN